MLYRKLALGSALLAVISVVLAVSLGGPKKLQAEEGEDVVLVFVKPLNISVSTWIWKRESLYLMFYRDNRLYDNFQHKEFQGRVRLADPQMKDGNISIILSNTTVNDTGIYTMFIVFSTEQGIKTTEFPLFNVKIVPAGHKDGGDVGGGDERGGDSLWLKVGLLLAAVVLMAAGICIICYHCNQSPGHSPCPSDEV